MKIFKSFKGQIEVRSGRIIGSDPCYVRGQGVSVKAKNGNWNFVIQVSDEKDWGKRIANIEICHEHPGVVAKMEAQNCGVDSGQYGFYDDAIYNGGDDGSEGFYEKNCEATLSEKGYGVINARGVVSSSGYGDGGYTVLAYFNKNGECVKLRVDFIDDESKIRRGKLENKFKWFAKLEHTNSNYGINGGRIVQLQIEDDDCNFYCWNYGLKTKHYDISKEIVQKIVETALVASPEKEEV
jgi:hypothetical protein